MQAELSNGAAMGRDVALDVRGPELAQQVDCRQQRQLWWWIQPGQLRTGSGAPLRQLQGHWQGIPLQQLRQV